MKRSALLRHARLERTRFRVRSRGATEKRGLKPMSAKRKALMPERTALLLGLKDLVGWVCEFCRDPKCWPLDGHEVRKPRSRHWLDPNMVCILGRPHHDMAEASYQAGRLEIPGTRRTGWQFRVVYAASKFVRQAGALRGAVHG